MILTNKYIIFIVSMEKVLHKSTFCPKKRINTGSPQFVIKYSLAKIVLDVFYLNVNIFI